MALITTSKSLGWYGVHGSDDCEPMSLHEHFGTYNSSGSFQIGKSGLSKTYINMDDVTHGISMAMEFKYGTKIQKSPDFFTQRTC